MSCCLQQAMELTRIFSTLFHQTFVPLTAALQRYFFQIWTYIFPLDTGFVLRYGLLQLWPHCDTSADDVVNHGRSCCLQQAMELTWIFSTSFQEQFQERNLKPWLHSRKVILPNEPGSFRCLAVQRHLSGNSTAFFAFKIARHRLPVRFQVSVIVKALTGHS